MTHGGDRWLVAPNGERAWVKNARAAGQVTLRRAHRPETVTVEAVGGLQAAPILKKYLGETPITRRFFTVTADARLSPSSYQRLSAIPFFATRTTSVREKAEAGRPVSPVVNELGLWTAAITLALALFAAPHAAEPQQVGRVYRLGYLSGPPVDRRLDSFRQGLRDLGYLEGRNIVLEIQSAEGKLDRLPDLAAEFVRRKVDLIVTDTGTAAVAAKKATQTIPIVMLGSGDAVRQGLVTSLARPGGNVTGLTMISPAVSRKRLELLRELLPKLSHVGVLWCGPGSPVHEGEWMETQAAADVLGVRLSSLEAGGREDLARAFASASQQRVEAVVGFDCPQLVPSAALIAELSLKHRLPAMYPFSIYPQTGSLMSYGVSFEDAPRRAATYVDKILRGAKPADLPVEQPTNFKLVINTKTAKTLGLTIPQSLLLRADQVIE